MTWIFILPLFKFWKQKGKGLSFLYIPQRRRRRRKKIIYRRLRNCWKRSTRWATSETGPGDLLLHDRKTPNGCCFLLLMVFWFYFLLLLKGGPKKRYTTLSKLFVWQQHTTHLCFDNSTQILMIHTLKLWSRIFKMKQNFYFATICRRLEMWEDNCWCFGRIVVLCRRNTTTN
jgi:hypothetical protein